MNAQPIRTPPHSLPVHCAICVNTKPPKDANPKTFKMPIATVEMPTLDGSVCVCDEHTPHATTEHTTVDIIGAAKRTANAIRRAT